jgi:hypothetical protein
MQFCEFQCFFLQVFWSGKGPHFWKPIFLISGLFHPISKIMCFTHHILTQYMLWICIHRQARTLPHCKILQVIRQTNFHVKNHRGKGKILHHYHTIHGKLHEPQHYRTQLPSREKIEPQEKHKESWRGSSEVIATSLQAHCFQCNCHHHGQSQTLKINGTYYKSENNISFSTIEKLISQHVKYMYTWPLFSDKDISFRLL